MSQIGEAVSPPGEMEEPEEVEHLVAETPKRMINFSC